MHPQLCTQHLCTGASMYKCNEAGGSECAIQTMQERGRAWRGQAFSLWGARGTHPVGGLAESPVPFSPSFWHTLSTGATSPALDKQVFVFLLKHMLVSPKLHVHLWDPRAESHLSWPRPPWHTQLTLAITSLAARYWSNSPPYLSPRPLPPLRAILEHKRMKGGYCYWDQLEPTFILNNVNHSRFRCSMKVSCNSRS